VLSIALVEKQSVFVLISALAGKFGVFFSVWKALYQEYDIGFLSPKGNPCCRMCHDRVGDAGARVLRGQSVISPPAQVWRSITVQLEQI
jgi:hypothetical protein